MAVLFFIIGLIIGALLVGFVLKSKNSGLQAQIDFMKEQELKNEEIRNKQFETQIKALKSELQNATEKLLQQRGFFDEIKRHSFKCGFESFEE